MEIERQHRTTTNTPPTTTSELFICFTSRLTKSSSMRLSHKSIQSPSHTTTTTTTTTDPTSKPTTSSLSTSLSRRLRHNRSLRGAQSPAMFPSSSKKNRGSSVFTTENPEPSSPKVTCIGQVRVKTRKQGKKMKMRACRSKRLSGGGSGGEVSFRRVENVTTHTQEQGLNNTHFANQSTQECGMNQRNQKWVHLPITICEALRAFGSEFSCLFPCKSSCFSSGVCGGNGKERERERESGGNGSSCAVFRWLVSLQEGEEEEEGGKRRDIELVVGEEEEVLERETSRRRSIFDDMEFDDLFKNVDNSNNKNGSYNKSKSGEIVDDDEGRVSVCVPPKNALLLMRCRSDPMKMASLSRKLWDPPLVQHHHDDGSGDVQDVVMKVEDVVNEVELVEQGKTEELQSKTEELHGKTEEFVEGKTEVIEGETGVIQELESSVEILAEFVGQEEEEFHEKTEEKQGMQNRGILEDEKGEIFEETHVIEDEVIAKRCSITEDYMVENEQDLVISNLDLLFGEEEEASNELVINESNYNNNSTTNEEEVAVKEERENAGESSEMSTISSTTTSLNSSEESTAESKFEEEEYQQQKKKSSAIIVDEEERKASFSSMEDENKGEKSGKLPDCLLLMMCEPKLSMEVSKETWVCSTDFIRWLPERHHSKKTAKMEGSDEAAKKKKPAAVGPVHVPVQQGRSSISFPAGSVANLIEKKLVKTGTYEPFVLTRCKSAPVRPMAKISAPEMACGRKIEPHRPATFGVGF